MKLSVTLILRNEEKNVRRLLPQLAFADEVIAVDTGSEDGTRVAARQLGAKVFDFVWKEDFAAARNNAISHASGDWIMWLDADDMLPAATQTAMENWKRSSPRADVYYMRYRMSGEFPFWFYRERIVRNCAKCRFKGFVHEAIVPFGKTAYLDAEVVHCPSATHEKRNLEIYRRAIAEGRRFSARDKYYYARTLAENGMEEDALPILRAFVRNTRACAEDRMEAYKMLAKRELALHTGNAVDYLSRAVKICPPDGETCCLFGQIYFDKGDFFRAAQWYKMALVSTAQSGFVNEYYTAFLPNVQLSVCMWNLGDISAARIYHNAARNIAPQNPTIIANNAFF